MEGNADEAVEVGRMAVATTPADHPDRARYLSNLGHALQSRFLSTRSERDLDAAVEAGQAAVEATPTNHPNLAGYLSNLGLALRTREEHSGVQHDREEALSAYSQAAGIASAPPSDRIRGARNAAALAAPSDSGRAADLLESAVLLLPEVAPRQLKRSDQQYALGGHGGLAADAAALALSDPRAPGPQRAARALQLLEAGRSVLLSQALDARSDLTDLREKHPALADQFVKVRDQFDHHAIGPARYYSRRSCDEGSSASLTGHDAGCDG